MNVKDIEIPYEKDRGRRYRFFEVLPGATSWSILILPFVLSTFVPKVVIFFIIAYLLLWFVKSIGMDVRAIQGYKKMELYKKLNWTDMIDDLEAGKIHHSQKMYPDWHKRNIDRLAIAPAPVKPSDLIHAIIIATYKESREVLEPTIQAVLESKYDMSKVILVLAFEERGGPDTEVRANQLVAEYKDKFMGALAVKHPDNMPGEVRGKGGNITFAGRELEKYLKARAIDPIRVVVTTLDSDNRPHPWYLASVSYTYCICPEPQYISFQPIPIFTNNIWDAPAPMRVVATGNSFWMTLMMLRPHILRNFSAHAQSMQTLIDTDYWSVRTIVEDGHQFWRTYFRYEGKHEVYPIFLPIFQDAVFAGGYWKTLKAQFIQMRRWAWGASDIAYVAEKGFFTPNTISRFDVWAKWLRLMEGHVSWATSALLIAFGALIPALFNPKDLSSNLLPITASRIETIALAGIFVTLYFSLKILPPKPARYKRRRTFFMIIQWVYLPVTTIVYSGASALYSQTRLMFGKYLDKFDVTEKAVRTEDNKTIL